MKARFLLSASLITLILVFLLCSPAWAGIAHQKVFVQQQTNGNGLTETFTANANVANDAVIVGVLCSNAGSSTPTNVTITASGWTFTRLGTINGSNSWSAVFGAIAPNTASTVFTVTWTAPTNCSSFSELGDEFSGNDATGGTITFDSAAQTALSHGSCTLNVTTGNADDAVWGACWASSVTGSGSGYAVGANDGAGDWSEYKTTTDGAGTWEMVNFTATDGQFNEAAVTIKPAPLGQSSPSITSLSPSIGPVSSTAVIAGANFGSHQGSSTLTFNGTSASVSSWASSTITATVPTTATTGNVLVTVSGTASNPVKFTVINAITQVKAFVQQGKSGNGLTDTFTAAASAPNDAIVVAVSCANGGIAASNVTLTGPGWTGANAFQRLGTIGTSAASSIAVFGAIAPNTAPATFTVTWTDSSNCSYFREVGDEFAGADATGGTTTFDCAGVCTGGANNANSSSGSCSVNVTTGSANEAVWAACFPSNSVTALGSGYSLGAIDGSGGETEFKVTTSAAGTAQTAGFTSTSSYNAIALTIKPPAAGTPPSITSLSPSSAGVGTSVTITGTGFGTTQGSSTVAFNGAVGTPTSWSNTTIAVPVPSAATTGNVVVKVGGRASNAVVFNVPPNITSVSPNANYVGTSVTITGTGFGPSQGSSTVKFNGTTATVTSWSATSITPTVPNGATTGNISVTVNGITSNGVGFTVIPPPSISSLSPSSGPAGIALTITGSNFGSSQGNGGVTFNGTAAPVTSWSNGSIGVTVPDGATTGNVVVTANGSVASNAVVFTVVPPPQITSLSPTYGFMGTPVKITGSNFGSVQGSGGVTFNGIASSVTSWSDTVINVIVPSGASAGNVVVTTAVGAPSNSQSFTVLGVVHQKVFVQHAVSTTGLTDTFTASANAANDVVIVGALCSNSGSSIPSDASLTAPGWTFTRLGIVSGVYSWNVLFGAIAPNTTPTTFTVTWTAATSCSFMGELGDEFSGADTTGGTTTFDNIAQTDLTNGACTLNVFTGNANDAVWGACWANPVNGVGSGYTLAGNDGAGDWSEYKNTSDSAGTWETVNFKAAAGSFNEVAVTIKPAVPAGTAPLISGLSPNLGAIGSTIVITGTNFGSTQGSSSLTFNGTAANASSWSATRITATVPAGATSGNMVVTVAGAPSNPVMFTVLTGTAYLKAFVQQAASGNGLTDTFTAAASAPNDVIVVAVSCVNGGIAASNVTLTAPGWTGANAFQRLGNIGTSAASSIAVFGAVAPNTTPATFTVTWTDSSNCSYFREAGDEFAGADATGGTTTFDCAGACSGGSNNAHSSNGSCSVNVTTGSANETVWGACFPSNSVTALGSGYTLGAIDGGGGEAEFKFTTSATGTVQTAGFTSTTTYNAIAVTIRPFVAGISPSISSLTPNSGAVGTSVTINGAGFGTAQGSSTVLFSGVAAAPTSWSDTSITVPVPSSATSGNVLVIVGGLASNAVTFTIVPSITSLTPPSGAVGASVTIVGTGFGSTQGNSSVTFNGTTATVNTWSPTSITTTVPVGATTGNLVVDVGGILSAGVSFTVPIPLGITGLLPTNISAGFADSSSATLNFPTPWEGAPNVVFIGAASPAGAGAIRIDNPTDAPLNIDSVTVDLQRPTAQFSLWGSFTIPANGSVILTQTQPGNFATSSFPIVPCGGTLSPNETRIPRITVTIAGTPQNFMDTAHVLDTGGFDLSCRGNESLQWRQIATTGITNPAGQLTLTPASSSGTEGSPVTTTAQLSDASGVGLANVAVDFKVLSGPNAGQTGQTVTDSLGRAQFTYSGSNLGTDMLQASVTNSSNDVFQSSQVTVNWQAASCSSSAGSQSGAPTLVYIGATAGEFNDSVELAALLTDSTGTPAAGRSITFLLGGQNFSALTDATGVARVTTTISTTPGSVPVNVSFAGDSALPALQASQNIAVNQDETRIRYTGATLLGNSAPQTVSAVLFDPQSLEPIPNEQVTFTVGAVTATATTNSSGVATTTIAVGTQFTGPSSITISFGGDQFFRPAATTVPVIVYFPAGFVIWGGNAGGLKIGQQVNFWGAKWENQVTSGQYSSVSPAFKGWSGLLSPIQQCQPNATPNTLTTDCWQIKPGQSFPPSETLPNFIDVVVSTLIVKSGDTVFGNIACGAVVQVSHKSPYGGVPGQAGYGTIAAVDGNCGGVFPSPAVISATQTQTPTVLPNQQITITTTVTNASNATAATNVNVSEILDGVTPANASANIGNAATNGSISASFQATVPVIPGRQGTESSTDYIQRLSALDGRVYTATGSVTFTDAQQQDYLPVDVFSQSILKVPVLTLALTGPAVVSPGTAATYFVTATNIGSAPATSVQINVTLPDGSTNAFSIPSIVPGSGFSQPVTFTPAALAPKGANETTGQYLQRLAAADGEILSTSVTADWSDAQSNAYGEVGQQVFSTRERVPMLSFSGEAPSTLLPAQDATLNFTINNTGGCTAVNGNLQVTNPDNTVSPAPQFPLPAGQSTTAQTTWHVTVVGGHLSGETDTDYQARLAALNNSTLNFIGSLSWTDPSSVTYGPTTEPVQSTQVLPIVTVALTAPANVQAGATLTYGLTATNVGGASSPAVSLAITKPDGSVQVLSVVTLAPGASFQTTINYLVPVTQPAGTISAQALVLWNDAAQNGYGPLSSTAQTTVSNPTAFNSLVLTPAMAGPNVAGTTQILTATLKDPSSNPIANASVQFQVTGTNPTTGNATTNTSGVATFSYSGTVSGNDSIQATAGTAVSNTATVSWVIPVQAVSTNTIFARFFTGDNSGSFNTPATASPAFTQEFPTINFNPPAGTVPGNTSSVSVITRPFTDVTTDLNGNFTGTIVAQGNGFQAGVGSLFKFQAVFTSTLTVASAGDVVLNFFSDDGFIFGVGGGATRVSGPMVDAPASGLTAFEGLPVMGAYNFAIEPTGNIVVVHFPAAGTYPYELDFAQCCGDNIFNILFYGGGPLTMTMTVGQTNSTGVPPTGSLVLSPNNPATLPAGQTQTFTAKASDASGNPVANSAVALFINGANPQLLNGTTDTSGNAVFSYSAVNPGTDTLQALSNISSLGGLSNAVTVNWSVPTGGGGGGGSPVALINQGWIGTPISGATVQTQIPITIASGIILTSGTLKFWPTSNPSDVHVLNSNTTGQGTLGTFDATTLANGSYTVQLQATSSTGATQASLIVLTVFSANKPGRMTFTETDFKVPLAGMPISIARTYDSLNRGKVGDFGFGWSLATTVDLQVDSSHNVSFTINGQRHTFFFQAVPISFLLPYLLVPQYVPEVGVHGSLTADGCDLMKLGGNLACFGVTIVPYSPTTYTYTDPIGRVFVIAASGQLQSIRDLNGNVLTFGPSGMTSSLAGGVTVPFVRDGQGRITQISDLSTPPNVYTYSYDGAGNLASVSLPGVALPDSYAYDSTHLLTGETDPRGNTTTTQYDANGRVQSITSTVDSTTSITTSFAYTLNSDGSTTTTTTFPDSGVQVRTDNIFGNPTSIKDPLNRTTRFAYDSHQNVITRTDTQGFTTSYQYDANGFQTSVTDPLQHTTRKTYNQFGGVITSTDALNSNTTTIGYDGNFNPNQWSDGLGQFQAATFDSAGNMLTLTNGNGKTTSFQYDARGNLTEIDAPLTQTTKLTYDPMDRISTMTDARQKTTTFQYDALGRLIDRIDAAQGDTHFEYDGNNNKISETDPLNHKTTYQYDNLNRLSKIIYPDQTTRQFTYDFRGNKLTETDQLSHITKYVYDVAGQLTSVTYAFGTADAATIVYTYDLIGRKLTETDGRGNLTTYNYDTAGRLTSVTDALSKPTRYGYDADNRRTSMLDPNQHTTGFAYDIRGRLQTVTYHDQTTTGYTYDNNNNQKTITDQAGLITTKNYDDLNRLSSVVDALQQTTQYSYDLANNLAGVTDANLHATVFGYDNVNRRNLRQLPLLMSESSVYDAAGNLASRTDFNGKTTTYAYDSLNRLLSKTPDASLNQAPVSFTYTATGKRASMQDASGLTTYTYDNRDRLITKVTPQGTLNYTYDGASNVLSIASSNANGASLSYTYDADDRLSSAADNRMQAQGHPGVTTYHYDNAGNLANYLYPNTVSTSYTYDSLNRVNKMSSLCFGATGCNILNSILANYNYTLGPAGNRTNVAESGVFVASSLRNVAYQYDNDYRLTAEIISGDPSQNGTVSYTYDPGGNQAQRNSTVPAIPATGTLTYDANDRSTTEPYDANGNLLNSGTGTNTWDFDNRLIQDGGVNIVYDGDGNRVAETVAGVTTNYLIDTQNPTSYAQVIDELVNGSVTRTYGYGLQRISENQLISGNWTPSFYGYDAHGSVRYLTNAASTVTDTYEYDAFGNLIRSTGSTPNNYRFSGEPFDPSIGLYQMRARWYRQGTGRFASRDPLDGVCCTPLNWNAYMYSLQNPVNNSDPTGRATLVAPPPVTAPPRAGGPLVEYMLVTAAIASATVAGSEKLAETILCGVDYLGSKVIALVEGGPINRAARCRVTAGPNPIPGKPRPGAVPWEFDPDDVRTNPDSGWDCNPALTECTKRCSNGNTSSLHLDDGIKYNEGRHWDYKDCNGKPWKIWPDGTMTPA